MTLPFPPDTDPFDFVGASADGLQAWLAREWVTPERFLRLLRRHVGSQPVTHNQRALLTAVLRACGEEWVREAADAEARG